MGRAIGFRAERGAVHWAVVSGTSDRPVLEADGKIRLPKEHTDAEALNWLRSHVESLLKEQRPVSGGIRSPETFWKQKPSPAVMDGLFARSRMEGVLLEIAAAKNIKIVSEKSQGIRSGMGAGHSAKEYKSHDDLRGIDWSTKSDLMKDAIMAAVATLDGD